MEVVYRAMAAAELELRPGSDRSVDKVNCPRTTVSHWKALGEKCSNSRRQGAAGTVRVAGRYFGIGEVYPPRCFPVIK